MSRLLNFECRYYGLVQMREDSRTGVYVENLSEVEVHSVQDVIQLLIQVPGYFLIDSKSFGAEHVFHQLDINTPVRKLSMRRNYTATLVIRPYY